MKKRLKNNILLKCVSVLIAIMIWLFVVNINDPVVDRTYTGIPVKVINGAYIESSGNMYRLDDEQQTVTVTLHGNSSKVARRNDDITAVADLTQIVDMNSSPIMVPVTVTCPGVNAEDISVTPVTIKVDIEEKLTQSFIIAVNTGDTAPGQGYEIGQAYANPEKVSIGGPESIVSKIDRVVASVSVAGLTGNSVRKAGLVIYDRNGDIMTESQTKYLTFDTGDPEVEVNVELWKTQSDVVFDVQVGGTPAEGYMLESVDTTPDTITVAGTKDALESLREKDLKITVPGKYVDIQGLNQNTEIKVDLDEILPDDLKLASNMADSIIVDVTIIPQGSRQVNCISTDIAVDNLRPGLQLVYDQKEVVVTVKGMPDALKAIRPEQIKLSIDLDGKEAGDYTVPVTVALPAGFTLVDTVSATVHLSEKEEIQSGIDIE